MLPPKSLLLLFLSFCLLFLIVSIPLGNAATGWTRTYGEVTRSETANWVIQTSDGGYAMVGSAGAVYGQSDAFLVKTGASGEMQWSQTYGGEYSDSGNSVLQTSDGSYVVAGTKNEGSENGSEVWLFKTDSSGNMQWEQTFIDTWPGAGPYGFCVVQSRDGGYAIAADMYFEAADEVGGFSLIKTDSSGNPQWNRTYGQRATFSKSSLVQTDDDGFALATAKAREGVRFGSDFWLIKTDSNGIMQWNRTYSDGLGDTAFSIVQTADNGYALAGSRGPSESLADQRHGDFMLVKTDSTGNMQWLKTYGGVDSETAYSVVQTTDGGYIMAGYSLIEDKSNPANQDDYNTNWVVKTDASGNTQWSKTYGNPDKWEIPNSIIQTTDGGYAFAGEISDQSGDAPHDFWLVKTDANGEVSSETAGPSPTVPEFPLTGIVIMALVAIPVAAIVFKKRAGCLRIEKS